MPVPPDDEDFGQQKELALRARQWRRAALALAVVFASLPMVGKVAFDSWRFDGALDLAGLCLFASVYFYFVGRDHRPETPDSALLLDKALQSAAMGATQRGLAILDQALRLDPSLWQAWEYRGRIHLAEPAGAEAAFEDFTKAIQLAPDEPHLYILRSQVLTLLGQETSARADLDAAARLHFADDSEPNH